MRKNPRHSRPGAKLFSQKPGSRPARGGPSQAPHKGPQKSPHRPQTREDTRLAGRWVIGLHSVREALKVRPGAVAELSLKEGWESNQDLREISEKIRKATTKPESWLDRLGSGHQGVAARMTAAPEFSWADLDQLESATILLLDGVQDPHNLGACLRTAWLLGAKALFIPEHRASPLTPTAMKVASGGAEHVPVVVDGNLMDAAKMLKDKGFWLFGLAGEAKQTLWQTRFDQKVALIIGSEYGGIRTPLARLCDELIRVPQVDAAASFNASVAAAIALAEVTRQLTQSPGKS
jgi:23S rRNA (guanosine2251-2'-O)-methyltransferase